MKALSFFGNEFSNFYDKKCEVYSTTLLGKHLHYGLIELEEPIFDPKSMKNQVLVEKKAFSCNYRGIAYILQLDRFLSSNFNQASYLTIGSEFCGVVRCIGDEVKNLNVGDRVIANGEYPFTSDKSAPARLSVIYPPEAALIL